MSQKKLQLIYEKILLENSETFPKSFPSGKGFLSNISPQSLGYRLGQYAHDKLKDITGFDYRKKVLGKDEKEPEKTPTIPSKDTKEPPVKVTKTDYKVITAKAPLGKIYKGTIIDPAELTRLNVSEDILSDLKNYTLKGITITDGTDYVVINFKYGRFVVAASSVSKPKTS